MVGKRWTPEEEQSLVDNYNKSSKEELMLIFHGRTWCSINVRASILKIANKRNNKNNEINHNYFSKLTNESCYWGGFLAADGCIYKNTIGITQKKNVIIF